MGASVTSVAAPVNQVLSTNAYIPNETSIWWSRNPLETGRRAVFMAHGYGGTALPTYQTSFFYEPANLAAGGFPVLTPDAGGASTWGNDTAMTALDGAFGYITSQPGVATDKIFLYGGSMGCLTVCNWAMRNPTKVKGIILELPAVSLQDLHDNRQLVSPGDIGALIETAYGGNAAYLTALPSRDPNTTANRTTLSAFPFQIWYSTNDPIAVASIATAFGAAVGAEMHSLGAVGHATGTQNWDIIRNFLQVNA
jgi:predicted alpha/beta hydrolase family esterase